MESTGNTVDGLTTVVDDTTQEVTTQTSQQDDVASQNVDDAPNLGDESFPEADKAKTAWETQRKLIAEQRKRIAELEAKATPQPQEEDEVSWIDLARVPGVPQQQTPNDLDLEDPATRMVYERTSLAELRANEATQQVAKLKADLENRDLWAKYPELNPKSQTRDKGFARDLEAQFLLERNKALMKGLNPPLLVDVADRTQERYEVIRQTVRQQAAAQERQVIAQKEAASLESRGTNVSVVDNNVERIADLRRRVNRGDEKAMIELMELKNF